MNRRAREPKKGLRDLAVRFTMLGVMGLLAGRAVYLQVVSSDYLQGQGNARHLRTVEDSATRGMVLDRNGEPLAISTPVESVWANPQELIEARAKWPQLAKTLGLSGRELADIMERNTGREFVYLRRHVTPDMAEQVRALTAPGVSLTREFRRYYPSGVVAGHVVGFTNIDDAGQEGLELAYNSWLGGTAGRKRVLKDRYGNVVETVESVSLPRPGRDLVISIDRRIQYLAYRELKASVEAHRARGASAIVLDVRTGEVLALVNEPAFNPNNREHLRSSVFRNRAVTDTFEPGSTVKPLTIAAALESGKFRPGTQIDTGPGFMQVGNYTIRDTSNHGRLTVAEVIGKSSNIGASKIALAIGGKPVWQMFRYAGFGAPTGSGLPGEAKGVLNAPTRSQVDQATLAYGYGLSVTPLQLARAYGGLANDGVVMPVTFLRRNEDSGGERMMSAQTARQVRDMLEMAVSHEGTGAAAQVVNYRVAGKTGTAHKLIGGSYGENAYIASFAGFAPATQPRLVMVIMVDQPGGNAHFGGQVAAPVFSRVMSGAMRLLNIPPDNLPTPSRRSAEIAGRKVS
jgi:cell division protein FtsI (penicillin-binding protein 3)